ncbi:unnamed protein product, partial [Trichobilharzia regenti]
SAWTNESLTNKSRISHWHNNSNNNNSNSNNNNSTDTKGRKTVNTKGNIFLQRRDFNVFTVSWFYFFRVCVCVCV